MGDVTILHNPRCTKSRATLALLGDHGIEPRIVDYLSDPPNSKELTKILGMLGIGARALLRSDEPEYRALGLDNEGLSEDDLVAAMCRHPRLIQRPIVVANGKAVIGRPPEAVLDIL